MIHLIKHHIFYPSGFAYLQLMCCLKKILFVFDDEGKQPTSLDYVPWRCGMKDLECRLIALWLKYQRNLSV